MRQLHRATHTLRHVDERAVGEHRRVEGRIEVVRLRHHRAQILLHQLWSARAGPPKSSRRSRRPWPALALKVVTTETLSNTASTATRAPLTPARISRSLSGMPSLVGAQEFRIHLRQALWSFARLWRGIVVQILEIDLGITHVGPGRLESWSSNADRPPDAIPASSPVSPFLPEMKRTVSSSRPLGAYLIELDRRFETDACIGRRRSFRT